MSMSEFESGFCDGVDLQHRLPAPGAANAFPPYPPASFTIFCHFRPVIKKIVFSSGSDFVGFFSTFGYDFADEFWRPVAIVFPWAMTNGLTWIRVSQDTHLYLVCPTDTYRVLSPEIYGTNLVIRCKTGWHTERKLLRMCLKKILFEEHKKNSICNNSETWNSLLNWLNPKQYGQT